MVVDLHSALNPCVERVQVLCAAHLIRLDSLEPVEEAGDPLEVGGPISAADDLGVGAEVDLRVEGRLAAGLRLGAKEVVELSKVAHAGRLDDAASPPAAAFDVSAGLAADGEVGVGRILTASLTALPAARALVCHVHAALASHETGFAGALVGGELHIV